jgi:hypothetical protein
MSFLDRFARWGGIGFTVLSIAGFAGVGDLPFDDGVKLSTFFFEHRARLLLGLHLGAVGMIWFLAWSWSIMKAADVADQKRDEIGVAVLVCGAVTAAVELGVFALAMTLAFISQRPADPAIARALANSYQVFSCVDYFPLAAFLGAVGVAVLRRRIAAAWTGWMALGLVPLSLVAAAPALRLDMPVAILVFVWMVATNISLLRAKR